MPADDTLIATLPAIGRLALAYATAGSRAPVLALLALDARLAGLIRNSREPMLAQLRLAWWRETLEGDAALWPEADPIFVALRSWQGRHPALAALVGGWDALAAAPQLDAEHLEAFVAGRGDASAALAEALDRGSEADAARRLGRIWAAEDLAMRLGGQEERRSAVALASREAGAIPRVSRALRPLRVLAGLARRRREAGHEAGAASPGAVLLALRLGLLGL